MGIIAKLSDTTDRHATVSLKLRMFEFSLDNRMRRGEIADLMREAFVDIDDDARPCWRMVSEKRFKVLWDGTFGEPDLRVLRKLSWQVMTTQNDIVIGRGDELRFDLLAHPVVSRKSGLGPRERGKRQHITGESNQLEWLHKRLELAARARVLTHSSSRVNGADRDYEAAHFTGVLVVLDPFELARLIRCGVGPSKHAGFGMLDVRPTSNLVAYIE